MEVSVYVSRPTEVFATEPVTPDNREAIWKWISRNGGYARIYPDGYHAALVLRTRSGAEIDVKYGERVLFDMASSDPDFWPIAPENFAKKYDEQGHAA